MLLSWGIGCFKHSFRVYYLKKIRSDLMWEFLFIIHCNGWKSGKESAGNGGVDSTRFAFSLFLGLIANVSNKRIGFIHEQAWHGKKIGYGLLPSQLMKFNVKIIPHRLCCIITHRNNEKGRTIQYSHATVNYS